MSCGSHETDLDPSSEHRRAIQSDLDGFLAAYKKFVASSDPPEVIDAWWVGGKLVTLFRHTECTDPNSKF